MKIPIIFIMGIPVPVRCHLYFETYTYILGLPKFYNFLRHHVNFSFSILGWCSQETRTNQEAGYGAEGVGGKDLFDFQKFSFKKMH